MSILILEHDSDSYSRLFSTLTEAGYTCLQAHFPEEILQLLHSQPAIDLILIGHSACERSKTAICNLLQPQTSVRNIPVLVVIDKKDYGELPQTIAAGASDYLCKPLKKDDILLRVQSIRLIKSQREQQHQREKEFLKMRVQLEETNRYLERLATLDSLTNLMNRRAFEHLFQVEWTRAARNQSPLSIILIDVDFFKKFNDSHGHLAGDQCLKAVAQILSTNVCRPADVMARFGGEEFIAALPGTPYQGALAVAERLRLAVETGSSSLRFPEKVTISLGVATIIPELGQSSQELIAQADRSLYWAKEGGRNRVGHDHDLVTVIEVPKPKKKPVQTMLTLPFHQDDLVPTNPRLFD